MTAREPRKGARWEVELLKDARAHGFDRAVRPRQEGFADVGDLHVGPLIVQAKDWRDVTAALREGVDGAVRQRDTVGWGYPVAAIKRARRPVGEAYAVMPWHWLLRLASELG